VLMLEFLQLSAERASSCKVPGYLECHGRFCFEKVCFGLFFRAPKGWAGFPLEVGEIGEIGGVEGFWPLFSAISCIFDKGPACLPTSTIGSLTVDH
jgi:hypothetical protein